jgi:hypothetical protein
MKTAIIAAVFCAGTSSGALAQPLTVVELYQSQGCSSCPPAIRNVNALVDKPNVLPLMFAVTYWDRLGWKDTFARAEFTERQWSYAHGLHREKVYTPQIVLNGQTDLVGTNPSELAKAIHDAKPLAGPSITVADKRIKVAGGTSIRADVWLVRYDPRTINVAIGAGENSGVTIPHRNIVRQLILLGGWHGAADSYALPDSLEPSWRTVILIQEQGGKAILSAVAI